MSVSQKPPQRIWIVNQFANTPDRGGGTRQWEFAEALTKKGFQVSLIASDYHLFLRKGRGTSPFRPFIKEIREGVEIIWIYSSPYQTNNWKRYMNMLSFSILLFFVSFFQKRPDVVVGSSPQLLAALSAWFVARVRKARFILEIRDLWPQVFVDMAGKSPKSPIVRVLGLIERFLYKNSERVIILAEGCYDYVLKNGGHAGKIHWLPNSAQIELFKNKIQNVNHKSQAGHPNVFTAIYAGAHGPANALSTLVEAAKILDQAELGKFKIICVGDGPDKDSLLKQSHGVKSIEFRDPIPKKNIPEFLHSGDVLILSLKDVELFKYGVSPNKLYDYYATGKPVLVAVGGFINREVEEFNLGIAVPPEDPQQLAQALIRFSRMEKSELAAMGNRARDLALERYNREVVSEKLVSLLNQ